MVVSDNGPQYSSEAYAALARQFQFEHVTSSPHYPQSNGEAERAVQTVKNLLKKDGDPYLALLAYRSTPLKCGFSPSELLMARKLRTNVPMTRGSLKPAVPDPTLLRGREEQYRNRVQSNYDQHHGVRDLEPLSPGQTVWIPDRGEEAHVVQEADTPRSYEVQTSEGTYRRNRCALIDLPNSDAASDPIETNLTDNDMQERPLRRSSRESHPPDRLDTSWNTGHS